MNNRCLNADDLPPCPPEWNFVFCPDPMLLTDEQLDELFPRERRREFWRDLARLTNEPSVRQHNPTTDTQQCLEKVASNAR